MVLIGVKVGTVKQIQLGLDPQSRRFLVPVTIELEPNVVRTRGGEPMDKFLADVGAISAAASKLMSAQATQDLPRRLDATLRHLESLAARFEAQGGPILNGVRGNLAEMHKALLAAQAALAKLETAADRMAELTRADGAMVSNLTSASEELARAAGAVRNLTGQESPTVANVNAALKEIARAANALRLLAETLEQQPEAIWRGKRQQTAP